MKTHKIVLAAGSALVFAASVAGAQGRSDRIPPGQMPAPGMCRVWIEGVPPGRQPGQVDCATARANHPANSRIIYGGDTRTRTTIDPRYSDGRANRTVTDPRYDSRSSTYDPRYDSRASTYDPRYDPRSSTYDPRYDARSSTYDPRYDSRSSSYDPRLDPRNRAYDARYAARYNASVASQRDKDKHGRHQKRDNEDKKDHDRG